MNTTTPDTRVSDRLLGAFYAVVALIALTGQAGAAVTWLHWPLPAAVGAVAALELGGIALAAYADVRRRLGERVYAARVLSAAVAAFAVAFNWLGHHDRLQAAFFAGMSALGYGVWLIHSGARRRDQLRATGDLPQVPPAYGLWQWARHPWLTRRARMLAQADPALGLFPSLAAARAEIRREARTAAIADVLRRKLTEAAGPRSAEIAVTVYDLDELATRLAASADYDGLTRLLAADLSAARLAAPTTPTYPAPRPTQPLSPTTPITPSVPAAFTSTSAPSRPIPPVPPVPNTPTVTAPALPTRPQPHPVAAVQHASLPVAPTSPAPAGRPVWAPPLVPARRRDVRGLRVLTQPA